MMLVRAMSLFALLAANQPGAGTDSSIIPEENYDFLLVTDGPCIPKAGIDENGEWGCGRMTQPRRYRGTWYVAFETSLFTPLGKRGCIKTRALTECAELEGKALPWPPRWACARQFEVEFIGRRNLLPQWSPSAYRVVVDRLISAKRLPDPPHEPNECDPAAP